MALSTFGRTLLHKLAWTDPENSERGCRREHLPKIRFFLLSDNSTSIKITLNFKDIGVVAISAKPAVKV